jgi:hypothetical protein
LYVKICVSTAAATMQCSARSVTAPRLVCIHGIGQEVSPGVDTALFEAYGCLTPTMVCHQMARVWQPGGGVNVRLLLQVNICSA